MENFKEWSEFDDLVLELEAIEAQEQKALEEVFDGINLKLASESLRFTFKRFYSLLE